MLYPRCARSAPRRAIVRSVMLRVDVPMLLALLAFVSCIPAHAQDVQKLEPVEITGSSLRRVDAEAALPVQVITRQEIERGGASSLTDLLQKLPAVQRFTSEGVSIGAGGSGYAGVSLHGLGESRSLVLLNGRRVAPFGGQTLTGRQAGVDLKTLPLMAIERIELLTDGASAVYGADAIGGVVNIITRRDFSGAEAAVSVAAPEHGGGAEYSVSVVKGVGAGQAEGDHFVVAAGRARRRAVSGAQRGFARSAVIDFSADGKHYRLVRASALAIPANVLAPGPLSPWLVTHGSCPPGHVALDGACLYDYASAIDLLPASEQNSVTLSLTRRLQDGLRFFAEALVAHSSTVSRLAPTPGSVLIPAASPLSVHPAQVGVVGDAVALWRIADLGQRITDDRSQATHLAAGVSGRAGAWDYSAALTRSVNDYRSYLTSGWVGANAIGAALASGQLNPFVEPGGQTPAGLALLDAARLSGYFDGGRATLSLFDLRASRPVLMRDTGPIMFGAGVSAQRDGYQTRPGELAMGRGERRFGDASLVLPYSAGRSVRAAHAELLAPLTSTLEASGALRHDDYSDFGASLNSKLALRWQPLASLMGRVSMGTGFRAPTIPQVSAGRVNFGLTTGSYACPFAPGDLPPGVACPGGVTQYQVFAEGNRDLQPENARFWSLGARWEPAAWWSFGFDYWAVNLKDTIGQVDESTAFADPLTFRSAFTSFVDPVSGATLLALKRGNVNLGKAVYRGVDFDVRSAYTSALGPMTTQLLASTLLRHRYQRLPGGPFFSDLGVVNDGEAGFRWQGRLVTRLRRANWSHSLSLNFKSGYQETASVIDRVFGARLEHTRRVASTLSWDWSSAWVSPGGIRLALGVLNLTDRAPPLTLKNSGQQVGYDERYSDPRQRTWYAHLHMRF